MIKDRFFIFLTVVLLGLFIFRVLEDIQESHCSRKRKDTADSSNLTMLKHAGIVPREAKYYEIIEQK